MPNPKPIVLATSYELTEPHGPTLIDGAAVPWEEASRPQVESHPDGGLADSVSILWLEVLASAGEFILLNPDAGDGKGQWVLDGTPVPWYTAAKEHARVAGPVLMDDGRVKVQLPVLIYHAATAVATVTPERAAGES